MSIAGLSAAPRRLSGKDLGLILGVLALLGGIIWLMNRDEARPVDRSAIGLRALERVISQDGAAISYANLQTLRENTLGLRILPILDTDIQTTFERPPTDDAFLKTGTETDLSPRLISRKISSQPTLLVAAKWTRAMRYSGYAHESLRIGGNEALSALTRLNAFDGPLIRPREALLRFRVGAHDGLLYAPQLFPPRLSPDCVPLISVAEGHLLIECSRAGGRLPVWLLSDPDLINNHGITLGDNAVIASEVLREIAGDKPILIDPTDRIFSASEPRPRPARDWSDLLRFFEYPLSIAWYALAGLTALLLWRAWIRFGPPRTVFDDRLSASRDASIAAKARILRLVDNDPRLFEAHIANRLHRIEMALFGSTTTGDPVARIVTFLKRIDPERAAGFAAAAANATTPAADAGPAQLQAALEDFELQAERLFHGS